MGELIEGLIEIRERLVGAPRLMRDLANPERMAELSVREADIKRFESILRQAEEALQGQK